MRIWKQQFDITQLQHIGERTMSAHLGMEIIEIGDDFLKATMPVDHRTVQPFRILHGGASVALAETLGSFASTLCIEDLSKKTAVGLEINANHLRSVAEGSRVIATCKPLRLGRTVHVWNIEINNEKEQLVCVSRLTVAIIDAK